MKKRVLWILNHETLSEFELPLIKDLGFEIFTPKKVPKNILQLSGSVTFDYDDTLTIPLEDLQKLNEYNFYEPKEMPFNIRQLINKYFDIAIVMFDFYALNQIVENFKGYIFARAFGLGKDITYYEVTKQAFSEDYFYKLEKIKDRFWFSHCYENIPDIETGIYKEKAVYMPLGLPKDFYSIEDQWSGEMEKMLFFCTRINFNPESGEIYKKFKRDFKGFDYIVAGNQPVPVNDDKVIGFLDRDELNDLYRGCRVMYYHSTYPRHLHYHPLEAMISGMPVVYLEGGALSLLAGERKSGCCKDISEARKMVKRILNGDSKLIEEIKADQKAILYKFSYEYNKAVWMKNFVSLIENAKPIIHNNQRTLGVFISKNQIQQHKSDYIEMFNAINNGIKEICPQNKLVINVQKNKFDIEHDFNELLKNKVAVMEYDLEPISSSKLTDIFSLMFKQSSNWNDKYIMPVDNVQNFIDFDYWLFMDDKLDKPIAPIKSYGLYIENLLDRNYEVISSIRISNIKNASFILTTSEQTKVELIKHLGVNKNKIIVIPFSYSISKVISNSEYSEDHILIEVDLNRNSQIVGLLNDIVNYFRVYNNDQKIVINCNNYFNKKNATVFESINNTIKSSKIINNNVTLFAGIEESDTDFLYAKAKKIIIPHQVENVLFKLKKAIYFSKHVILNDYPFYKDFEAEFSVGFDYRDFNSKRNILLDILTESSKNAQKVNYDIKNVPNNLTEKMSQAWRAFL